MSARSIGAVAWLLATIGCPAPTLPDAANGERLARQWCAACHVVSTDQQQASADAPPFATIGRAASFNAEKLALFLLDPHPKMPSLALSRREAADIAEYIVKTAR